VLRGFHKVILGQLPELIVSPFIFLMILCVLVYGYKIKEFSVYLLILSCSYLFALIFCLVALCRLIDFKKLFQSISVNSRKYSALGVPFLWLNVLSVGTREMDAIMLGLLGEMSDVGVYGVVQRGVRLITFAEASVTMAVAASFSYSYSKSDLVELQRQYIQASVIIFCFSAPILLGLIFFSRFYLSLFGDNFQVGVVPLIIMLLAHVIHLFVGPALVLLNMTNGVLEVVRILICILIIKLVLNFILIPEFGLYGVSISYFLAVLTSYILAAIVISKKLNVNAFITFLFLSRKNDEK
jgi:O-antigen/teichoic acid export membrane protein